MLPSTVPPPLSQGRLYTGAWGHCTGSNPESTTSFSKQCGILLKTGLKYGTEHSGVG